MNTQASLHRKTNTPVSELSDMELSEIAGDDAYHSARRSEAMAERDTRRRNYMEAERSWVQQDAKWEREGFKPGQLTAYIAGYLAGKKSVQVTDADLVFNADSSPVRRKR